jgi:hypothetical protein
MWYPDQAELLRERVVTSIVMPQPSKPVAAAQGAPAARPAPVQQATQAVYQGVPL